MAKKVLAATRSAVFLLALVGLVQAGKTHAASLLSNPGFEFDPGGHNQSLLGWQPYGGNTYNETSAADAHSGTNYFKVYQAFNGAVNYTGVYQDYLSGAGATYAADGWAFTATADAPAGQNLAWIEVTFRDAPGNILSLYRSALITTNTIAAGTFPKNVWNNLRVTNQYDPTTYLATNTTTQLVAPTETIFARYQIVFQGDANFSGGSVYFDDLNLAQTGGAPYGNMNIVWTDEFDGAAIKTNIWTYDLGNNGWGNSELEYYTSRTNNAFVTNGILHLVARKESFGGASYTSARMKSQGLFAFKYGRLEWRAKSPAGTGFWPALWLLGTNITSLNWPGCGEIDVFENNGSTPFTEQGSLHSGTDTTAFYNFIEGSSVTNFHTYTLDWTTNAFLFSVDGHLYQTQTSWGSSTTNAYPFPFNQPFFLLMNLAIGGNYLGNPTTNAINTGSVFPGEMQVDYVRLYHVTDPFRLAIKTTGTNLLLTWPSNIVSRVQTQTNLGVNGTNWIQVVTTTNQLQVSPTNKGAFYRLVMP